MKCNRFVIEIFLFLSLFRSGAIPIVMGAPRSDYERHAPPNSFIHVDDFSSPKHLAEYMHIVSKDEELYAKYFTWKKHWWKLNTSYYCRLCSLLHSELPEHSYGDINRWYRDESLCVLPSNNNPWASWERAKELGQF